MSWMSYEAHTKPRDTSITFEWNEGPIESSWISHSNCWPPSSIKLINPTSPNWGAEMHQTVSWFSRRQKLHFERVQTTKCTDDCSCSCRSCLTKLNFPERLLHSKFRPFGSIGTFQWFMAQHCTVSAAQIIPNNLSAFQGQRAAVFCTFWRFIVPAFINGFLEIRSIRREERTLRHNRELEATLFIHSCTVQRTNQFSLETAVSPAPAICDYYPVIVALSGNVLFLLLDALIRLQRNFLENFPGNLLRSCWVAHKALLCLQEWRLCLHFAFFGRKHADNVSGL